MPDAKPLLEVEAAFAETLGGVAHDVAHFTANQLHRIRDLLREARAALESSPERPRPSVPDRAAARRSLRSR